MKFIRTTARILLYLCGGLAVMILLMVLFINLKGSP